MSDPQKRPDGGCAFPLDSHVGFSPGMSLRDYFAAAALTGMYARDDPDWLGHDDDARQCYLAADAMLKARASVPHPRTQGDDFAGGHG